MRGRGTGKFDARLSATNDRQLSQLNKKCASHIFERKTLVKAGVAGRPKSEQGQLGGTHGGRGATAEMATSPERNRWRP